METQRPLAHQGKLGNPLLAGAEDPPPAPIKTPRKAEEIEGQDYSDTTQLYHFDFPKWRLVGKWGRSMENGLERSHAARQGLQGGEDHLAPA